MQTIFYVLDKCDLSEEEGFAVGSGQSYPWITALYEMWNVEMHWFTSAVVVTPWATAGKNITG